jgi:hypothetical protein
MNQEPTRCQDEATSQKNLQLELITDVRFLECLVLI